MTILKKPVSRVSNTALDGSTMKKPIDYRALSALGVAARLANKIKTDSVAALKAHCSIDAETQCWNWTGVLTDKGYVRIRGEYANRTMFRLANGAFDESLEICHTCDNPRCINPSHLWAGTHKENMLDCSRKGRLNTARGERQPTSKLTTSQASFIKRSSASLLELASQFGVCISTISKIRTGKNWNWI